MRHRRRGDWHASEAPASEHSPTTRHGESFRCCADLRRELWQQASSGRTIHAECREDGLADSNKPKEVLMDKRTYQYLVDHTREPEVRPLLVVITVTVERGRMCCNMWMSAH